MVIGKYEGLFRFEINLRLADIIGVENFLRPFLTKKSGEINYSNFLWFLHLLLLLLDSFGDTLGLSLFIVQLHWCDWVEQFDIIFISLSRNLGRARLLFLCILALYKAGNSLFCSCMLSDLAFE